MSARIAAFAFTACALVAGCASEGAPPREQMARARTLVEQADKADAQRYAAADLQRAHDELSDAQRAYNAQKWNDARTFAESSAADADLASARAAAGAAHQAATEVARGNNTLRQETQREANADAAAPLTPPPQ
jgi:hypothetical protein